MTTIDRFTGEYRFLSNFYPAKITYQGLTYKSTEYAYQAAKATDPSEARKIRNADTPFEAKRLGSPGVLKSKRTDWHSVSIQIMHDLLREKFKITELKDKLINTGDAQLIEGNTWGDIFWGVCNGKGENHLGKLLMKVRKEIA